MFLKRYTIRHRAALFASGAVLFVSACSTTTLSGRQDLASQAAAKAGMHRLNYKATPFELTSYQRISAPHSPIRVYIEGDGLAWLSKSQPSLNPTPTEPVALQLAARDNSANVVYLARPCQYTGRTDGAPCDMRYWMGSRYAPEVLQSYNEALERLKAQNNAAGFELIGFSGGATVAALLAGQRADVLSLRSVAGNLDHRAHSEVHKVSYLANSLNPPQYAGSLAMIPQIHFIGSDDAIVPRAVYDRYASALPALNCTRAHMVSGARHDKGWIENWPTLLAQTPTCKNS